MKIGELNIHCGNCPLIHYCTGPFDSPEICTIEELSDVDAETYRKYAEELTEADIEDKLNQYEENSARGWTDERAGAICDLILEKLFSRSEEHNA